MLHHFIQGLVRVVGVLQAHNFHFVKLVQTVQTTDVCPITARLTSEARSVACVFDREITFCQDIASVQVGHRHFSRWDKV